MNFLLDYWYVFPISVLTSFFRNKTRYKYAPLLCILLILTVPPLFPPSPLGLLAITNVQINDSIALRKFIKQKINRLSSLNLTELVEILLLVSIGSLLLLFYGCKAGFVLYSFASTSFTLLYMLRLRIKNLGNIEPKEYNPLGIMIAKYFSLILLSTSSYGFPYCHLEGYKLEKLALATLSAALINVIITLIKIGPSLLQINLLILIFGGTIAGNYISNIWGKEESQALSTLYHYITIIIGFITIFLEIFLKII
ncbi:hypothetical protein [Saccharolobus caldissimus]|uniref:hypothetical protein n=1 Tax=Saccharolobus caldissimus TaxID=1702097 RepID=UPI001E428295|nr:hypothetical protein [Saccharolobus caldissimus]